MDDLPFTFILIGLATLVVIFLLVATVLFFWQRHKRRRVHIDKVTVANSLSDNQSAYNKAGSTEYIQAAGGKGQHRTTVTHVFQGPAAPKKTFEAPPPPKGPPSSVDQLSQATMSTERAKSPQSNLKTVVIVGDDDVPPPEPRHATPSPKPRASLSPTPASNGPKPRDRSLKIDLPDSAQDNRLSNYRALPKDSPLTVRKFPERMEKLQENENERLYYEFEMLNKSTPPLKPATVAESHENIRKNRFYDILPFDENRVILQAGRGNYINASYVKDEKTGAIRYIAAQGPIGDSETVGGRRDATVVDFWRMMWDENVNCIVMLTQCVEGHRQKCAVYWPENAGETVHIDAELTMNLYCITEDDICFQREIWLEKQGHAKRKVVQWHYKEWRDAAGPQDAENLLTFMELVRASDKKYPLLVHCSAGVGRTGVFIALDILLDKLASESIIDVYETVSRLRQTRVNMVQSGEQYITLYEVIALAIRKRSASRYSG
ncbi:Protein-tyrosine phosphatase [Aphelenchoides avenae]|nr:Protein-tyrosine phosphatase [Aphelenchus avenae]